MMILEHVKLGDRLRTHRLSEWSININKMCCQIQLVYYLYSSDQLIVKCTSNGSFERPSLL